MTQRGRYDIPLPRDLRPDYPEQLRPIDYYTMEALIARIRHIVWTSKHFARYLKRRRKLLDHGIRQLKKASIELKKALIELQRLQKEREDHGQTGVL